MQNIKRNITDGEFENEQSRNLLN